MKPLPTAFTTACAAALAATATPTPIWRRTVAGRDCVPLRPRRLLPRTLFFAEIQDYRLTENYLHYWIDRPLFHDSSLRGKDSYGESLRRNLGLACSYSLDGFTVLGNAPSLRPLWSRLLASLAEPGAPALLAMAGAVYLPMPTPAWREGFLESYRLGAESPSVLRIGGRPVVWAYHAQFLPGEEFGRLRQAIAGAGLPPPFLFTIVDDAEMRERFRAQGDLTGADRREYRESLARQLRQADGIMVYPAGRSRPPRGEYAARPIADPFYRGHTLPLLLELLARPEFAGKAVGSYIYKGYVNHLSGNIAGQFGTSAFRSAMEEAMKLNPDILVFFEWNEANENTHYQPTLANGGAMGRLVRSYIDFLTAGGSSSCREPPAMPDLIPTSRQVVRLGEKAEFELLALPDLPRSRSYSALLQLKDAAGNTVLEFPRETFDRAEFRAVTLSLPTSWLPGEGVLRPVLEISADGLRRKFELRHLRIDPSVCSNYVEIMQPLREQLECRIEASRRDGRIEASAAAETPLRSFELLLDEDECAAAGRPVLPEPRDGILIRGRFAAFEPRTLPISFDMPGVPAWSFRRDHYRNAPDRIQVFRNRPFTLDYRIPFYYPEGFFIRCVPAPEGRLRIQAQGLPPVDIAVSELVRLGRWAQAFPDAVRLDLEIVRDLADVPPPLDRPAATLVHSPDPSRAYPRTAELRAVSLDGRICRRFLPAPDPQAGECTRQPILDTDSGEVRWLAYPRSRLRDIVYAFDPRHGALLTAPGHPEFAGELGGGFQYLEPFNRPRPDLLASLAAGGSAAPRWIREDHRWLLRFDGKANYVNFPQETLPYGAFTLEFEIRPEEPGRSEALFRNFSHHAGSLNLFRCRDRLTLVFTRRDGCSPYAVERRSTGLALPAGRWAHVRVVHDLESLELEVDGVRERFAFPHQGYFFKPSVFGGHVQPRELMPAPDTRFFHGDLRSLRVLHGVENPNETGNS